MKDYTPRARTLTPALSRSTGRGRTVASVGGPLLQLSILAAKGTVRAIQADRRRRASRPRPPTASRPTDAGSGTTWPLRPKKAAVDVVDALVRAMLVTGLVVFESVMSNE